jgi:hypothetical protein
VTVQRAELSISDQANSLTCLFNPAEYTMRKRNTYGDRPQPATSVPAVQYAGGRPAEMTVELLFDVWLSDPPQNSTDDITDRLFHAMEPEPRTGVPPTVEFKWGGTQSFTARVSELEVQNTLFKNDGTPVRAWARLTLVQALPSQRFNPNALQPGQNPTTRASGPGETWVVSQGDSLPSIAFATYRDATAWRAIASANGIDDPMRLRHGSVLTIPSREDA